MNIEAVKSALIGLAIRGKLVPQRDDEPAVEQIGEAPKEAPFEIPAKWKWVTIQDITTKVTDGEHKTPHYVPDGVPFISVKDITSGRISFANTKFITTKDHETFAKRCNPEEGDLLITKVGTTGVPAIVDTNRPFSLFVSVALLKPLHEVISSDFFYYALKSPFVQKHVKATTRGVNKNWVLREIATTSIPLPPLAEQRRIVAKLEELLEPLSRVQERLGNLTHDFPEQFKAAVLQKAIQGKLVPQRDDEPAVEQLGEAPKVAPFEIPAKWKWVTLSAVGKIVGGGTPKTQIPEYWSNGNIPWITPADLGKVKSKFIASGAKLITDLGLSKSAAQLMPAGTVLFSSRAPIGHIAIARQSCCTNQGCKSLVPNAAFITSDWGYYVMKAFTPDMINRASGTTFKEISGKGVAATMIPLPPLAEQRRIVDKVERLFSQVDELTARLSS